MSANDDDLFAQALALPPDERRAYLDVVCAGDATRRANLESMLRAHDGAAATSFMAATVLARRPAPETAGTRIGHYELIEKIDEGGWGSVFRARQREPVSREVAVKIIKLGMDTAAVVARFAAERQTLALMEHPAIAKVFDAGATETGRPYFVMELVRGLPITKFCDQQKLPTPERLRLFIEVCRAVQHAHQKGIIHRDLKPSNILVCSQDDKAAPKVIDFGIAKSLPHLRDGSADAKVFTAIDQFIGTPAYMSPEQAGAGVQDVDTRSDLYALGVILYELLTGRMPFELPRAGASPDEIRRAICDVEPTKPSRRLRTLDPAALATAAGQRRIDPPKLIPSLRGDLDWIVMKCLEKDRARRYDSAAALALDLERHLADQPVTAAAPGKGYVLGKLFRRHRVAFVAGSAIVLLLVGGLTATTWLFLRERAMLERARSSEQKTVEAFRAALKQQAIAQQERARTADPRAMVANPASRAVVLEALAEVYAERGEHAMADALRAEARELKSK